MELLAGEMVRLTEHDSVSRETVELCGNLGDGAVRRRAALTS
jgi:hypothetical protein